MPVLPAFNPFVQAVGEVPGQGAGEGLESADGAIKDIQGLDGLKYVADVLARGLIGVPARKQNLDEGEEKLQVLCRGLQSERIDPESAPIRANFEVRTTKQPRQLFIAASQIKDEGARIILLQ